MDGKVISGRRLDRRPRDWLLWAKKNGPVLIKEHGERRYVLMRYADYAALSETEEKPDAR